MVYGLVKQHSGYITCDSDPGIGTTFKIYLPVSPAVPTGAKSGSPTEKSVFSCGTETILLVDDEESVRKLGKRILETSGYTLLTASNGKEALDLYMREKDKISLVILDLIMPEMSGTQCLEDLLKIDSKARVLMASGSVADGQVREAIKTSARGFVSKPYSMKLMLQAVREVLDSD